MGARRQYTKVSELGAFKMRITQIVSWVILTLLLIGCAWVGVLTLKISFLGAGVYLTVGVVLGMLTEHFSDLLFPKH